MRLLRRLPMVVAVICVLFLPLWVLGVPGVSEGPFATGWQIGFYALLAYPLAILAIALLRLAPGAGGVSAPLSLAALGLFLLAQAVAWHFLLA